MAQAVLQHPELVGRREELEALLQAFDSAHAGSGSTYLISGEAGIGKTRLVSELLKAAEAAGALVIRGWCLPENRESLMPVKEALRSCGMEALISGAPPPKILSAYLLNRAGMLFARAERTESQIDPDIFAAMLTAVSSFVADSLRMMGKEDGTGFSSIGHSGYEILVCSAEGISLAVVVEGVKNEFLLDDIGRLLAQVSERVPSDPIDVSDCGWIEERLTKFVTSHKYDGTIALDDPRLKQENMLDNVLLGLQRESVAGPVVLFLDDLQWADRSTLGMLHYLSRNTRLSRVFILGTYRPEDVMQGQDGTPHPLETAMQDMSRESLFREIRLSRLGEDGTEDIVSRALGGSRLPPQLKKKIHDETEGNPFFVLEVLRLLVEEGIVQRGGEEWVLKRPAEDLHIPSKMFDVIRRRLNRLPKQQKDILECASVVGQRFDSEVVGHCLGMGRIQLLRDLNEIEKTHRLIHSKDRKYHFDHCKIRDVLYEGMGEELRVEYHRMVAMGYEQMFGGHEGDAAGELAHHFLEANDPRAAKYLVMAGDRARECYANEEAINFYNLALGMAEESAEFGRINECLGDLYNTVGNRERAIATYSNALDVAQGAAGKAELHRKMSLAYERGSEYDLGIASAQAGLDMLGETDDPVGCGLRVAMSLNYIKRGEYDKALELLYRAMMDATRLGRKRDAADAHRLMGITWWFRGDYSRALEHYQAALAIQREIGDDHGKLSSLNNIGVVYMETGRLDEALEYFMEGLEHEERVGDKSGMASALDNIGNLLHTRGEPEKALEYQLRGLELCKMTGDRNGVAWALSSLGYVYPDLGQERMGIESFLRSVEICKEIGDQHILTYNYYGLADKYADMGHLEKAREYVDKAMELATELGAKREQGTATYILGIIQRNSGQYNEAMGTFDAAREMLAEVGDTYIGATIDYDAGLCLAEMGESVKAREMLQRARDHFERGGMRTWLAKADRALSELDTVGR